MIQSREKLRFARETRHAMRIGGGSVGNNFDGHFAAQTRIAGAIDFSHAADSQWSDDLIWAKLRAGRESHARGLYCASRGCQQRIAEKFAILCVEAGCDGFDE